MLDVLKEIVRNGVIDEWPTEGPGSSASGTGQAIFGRHGPHTVAVIAPWGARLGYLRASLAGILAHRYARGEVFAARVAAVMGPDYDPNERLILRCGEKR